MLLLPLPDLAFALLLNRSSVYFTSIPGALFDSFLLWLDTLGIESIS